jgi:hypothetical protein
MLHSAGFPQAGGGRNPNFTVSLGPLQGEVSAQEFADSNIQETARIMTSYEVSESALIVVDGRDAMVTKARLELSDVYPDRDGTYWDVQLFVVDGQIGWTASCGVVIDGSHSEPDRTVCDAIVRSFTLSNS